jgi:hypothetical protein
MSDRLSERAWHWSELVIMAVLVVVAFLWVVTFGEARERFAGEFDNVDTNTRQWFRGVRAPSGVPCCDISDGHRTQARQATRTEQEVTDGFSEWWAVVEGEWMHVPQAAVIYNAGNPTGDAVVWWVRQGPESVHIRCFVPGGGV